MLHSRCTAFIFDAANQLCNVFIASPDGFQQFLSDDDKTNAMYVRHLLFGWMNEHHYWKVVLDKIIAQVSATMLWLISFKLIKIEKEKRAKQIKIMFALSQVYG